MKKFNPSIIILLSALLMGATGAHALSHHSGNYGPAATTVKAERPIIVAPSTQSTQAGSVRVNLEPVHVSLP